MTSTTPCGALLASLCCAWLASCDRPTVAGDPSAPWTPTARPELRVSLVDLDGQPVVGAWVTLDPGGRDGLSDEAGVARFHAVEEGGYRVEAAALGYALIEASVEVGTEDQDLSMVLHEPR